MIESKLKEARNTLVAQVESEFVRHQLILSQGNVTVAARTSGMTRQNFQRLMKKYNIESKEFRSAQER